MRELKAYLEMPWDELRVELCGEIHTALGEKGPWKHGAVWQNPKWVCQRCGTNYRSSNPQFHALCPVPPPITLEPEVVAERLLYLSSDYNIITEVAVGFWGNNQRSVREDFPLMKQHKCLSSFIRFPPTQRILCCLLSMYPEFCKE